MAEPKLNKLEKIYRIKVRLYPSSDELFIVTDSLVRCKQYVANLKPFVEFEFQCGNKVMNFEQFSKASLLQLKEL